MRGWVIGMMVAALLTVAVGYVTAAGSQSSCNGGPCHFVVPTGPGGEAVTDSFYFVHQPLAGNGSITVRVTSLTGELPDGSRTAGSQVGQGPQSGLHPGLEPWSKAGIIIKASTRQGSAYAAMLVTGSHGVRMQYNYTQDIAGPPGRPSAAVAALAAAHPLRRHDHRLRLRRRHALDADRRRDPGRAARHRAGRHVRHLPGLQP